jgi:hypothetical protein
VADALLFNLLLLAVWAWVGQCGIRWGRLNEAVLHPRATKAVCFMRCSGGFHAKMAGALV